MVINTSVLEQKRRQQLAEQQRRMQEQTALEIAQRNRKQFEESYTPSQQSYSVPSQRDLIIVQFRDEAEPRVLTKDQLRAEQSRGKSVRWSGSGKTLNQYIKEGKIPSPFKTEVTTETRLVIPEGMSREEFVQLRTEQEAQRLKINVPRPTFTNPDPQMPKINPIFWGKVTGEYNPPSGQVIGSPSKTTTEQLRNYVLNKVQDVKNYEPYQTPSNLNLQQYQKRTLFQPSYKVSEDSYRKDIPMINDNILSSDYNKIPTALYSAQPENGFFQSQKQKAYQDIKSSDINKQNIGGISMLGLGLVNPIVETVGHPVQTVKGTYQSIRHPIKSAKQYINYFIETAGTNPFFLTGETATSWYILPKVAGASGSVISKAGKVIKPRTTATSILSDVSMTSEVQHTYPLKTIKKIPSSGEAYQQVNIKTFDQDYNLFFDSNIKQKTYQGLNNPDTILGLGDITGDIYLQKKIKVNEFDSLQLQQVGKFKAKAKTGFLGETLETVTDKKVRNYLTDYDVDVFFADNKRLGHGKFQLSTVTAELPKQKMSSPFADVLFGFTKSETVKGDVLNLRSVAKEAILTPEKSIIVKTPTKKSVYQNILFASTEVSKEPFLKDLALDFNQPKYQIGYTKPSKIGQAFDVLGKQFKSKRGTLLEAQPELDNPYLLFNDQQIRPAYNSLLGTNIASKYNNFILDKTTTLKGGFKEFPVIIQNNKQPTASFVKEIDYLGFDEDVNIKLDNRLRDTVKITTKERVKEDQLLKEFLLNPQKVSEIQRQDVKQQEALKYQQKVLEKQILAPKQMYKPVLRMSPFKIKATPIRTKVPKIIPPTTAGQKNKYLDITKKSRLYNIFTKIKGKDVFLGQTTYGRGLMKGSAYTENYLTASFELKPTKKFTNIQDINFKVNKNMFRDYRISKGQKIPLENRWIQYRSKRLSSFGEKAEIKQARKKRGFKWF